MKTKICTKCGIKKQLSEFHLDKRLKDGHCYQCKICKLNYDKNYYDDEPWKLTFKHVISRCTNPKDKSYKDYGGRGIKCLISEEELKELWFRDKAYLMKKPSIDKKNNNGDYTFDNCQYIEWDINHIKDRNKPIFQYDLNGNFIKEWNSASEIEKQLKLSHTNISACCAGKRRQAYGFNWKFKTTCSITKK